MAALVTADSLIASYEALTSGLTDPKINSKYEAIDLLISSVEKSIAAAKRAINASAFSITDEQETRFRRAYNSLSYTAIVGCKEDDSSVSVHYPEKTFADYFYYALSSRIWSPFRERIQVIILDHKIRDVLFNLSMGGADRFSEEEIRLTEPRTPAPLVARAAAAGAGEDPTDSSLRAPLLGSRG